MIKKNKYILIILTVVFILFLGSGIYLLISQHGDSYISYNIDKYTDVKGWCESNKIDKALTINCKGLLLDIRNTEDGNSCFDIQVITKEKELKDISVCEKNDTLSYTNEVLEYKKLMPVNMVFTYNREGIFNNYIFSNVSFTKLDDTYIQNIVNEDIANLVTIDPSTTTIENSVDFCPKPETLPSYVTEENRIAYTEYFNNNIMAKEKYFDGYMYNWDDSIIRILFACDSAENMGHTDICNKTQILGIGNLSNTINHIGIVPQWGKKMDDADKALLKQISLVYDSMYKNIGHNFASLELMNTLVGMINSSTVSEEVFCGMYPLYENIAKYDNDYSIDKEYIKNTITNNMSYVTSASCLEITSDLTDAYGTYIKGSLFNFNYSIVNTCNNLNMLLK